MPELSRFYGIVIKMHHDEHNPPHFHAVYGGHRAQFSLKGIRLIKGKVPLRVQSLVREWAAQHLDELTEDWTLCQSNQLPKSIEPLD